MADEHIPHGTGSESHDHSVITEVSRLLETATEKLSAVQTSEVMPLVNISAPELHSIGNGLNSLSRNQLLAGSGLLAMFVFLLLISMRTRSAARKSTIILLGPSDAGKTAILSALTYGTPQVTHTSIQPNFGHVSLPSSKPPVQLVDVPGHPRMRAQFEEFLPDAKGIVFVVDSSIIARNGAVVAEHLHNILYALMSLPPSVKCPALLLYAHKVDLIARSSTPAPKLAIERIKTILERELEKRRLANVGGVGVEGLGAENEEAQMGGLDCQGETFKFDKWEGGEVDFASGWLKVARSDMDQKVDEKAQADETDSLGDLKDWMDGLR